jgi:cyclomaltodextrinase / maltogenic alpha-amylase / neopullulanase
MDYQTDAATGSSWTPEWVKDAVFYQIFPDRFASSSPVAKPSNLEPWDSPPTTRGFKGGDLLGVVENLDYLQDLGITAIYLNPTFSSPANHRYHTHDYYSIDPILGGDPAMTRLLEDAHRRNMKIVLDGVFNHVSRSFYQFSHLLENGSQSPYLDWFTVRSWPLDPYGPGDDAPGYDCWWNNRELPELHTETQAVREFLWKVGEHWIERGIDGWRLDVPNEIDDDAFWREFRRRVKRLNPEAYIVGEIWTDARRWLAGDEFDGVQNYLFTKACLGFFSAGAGRYDPNIVAGTGLDPIQAMNAEDFRAAIDGLISLYPWPATTAQLNQLDSHDTPRFLTMSRADESSLRLATLFQMTYPGAPCIYYGDEIGLQGGRDPDCRRSFPWQQSSWNQDLRAYVKRCIGLRRAHAVFRRGTFTSLYGHDGVYVFARRLDGKIAIIAFNSGNESQTFDVELPSGMDSTDLSLIFGDTRPDVAEGVIHGWSLPSRSAAVLLAGH